MTAKSSDHPDYRPDIDGLRAFAVLSVVIHHAWPHALPGGFIGVDVFFVISGYLISTIIFKGIDRGSFSFKDFYSSRIRRIVPALVLVLLTCLVVGWFALLAIEYKALGKHVASGAVFGSNITLLGESGYFDRGAELKPLLHLWSLGIEEQFYIAWPLLIFAAAKVRINLLTAVISLAALSFVLNVVRIDTHLLQTFYLPFTRFWELFLGAILAHVALNFKAQYHRLQTRFSNISAIGGLALVAAALLLLNNYKLFPGWWALLPAVGSVLIIAAGPGAWINRNVLATRPLVFVGLMSYPLYLWHWPLLAFLNIVDSSGPPAFHIPIAILLSFLLAWATYEILEKRLRYHPSPWVVRGLVAAIAVTGVAGKLLQMNDGFPDRPALAHYKEFEKQMTRETATDAICLDYASKGGIRPLFNYCRANNLQSKVWVAIIGDSQAHVLFSGFATEFERRGLGTIVLANSSCPPFMGTATGDTETLVALCTNKIEQILSLLDQEKRVESVLVATRGPVYITGMEFNSAGRVNANQQIKSTDNSVTTAYEQIFFNGFQKTLTHVADSGKRVFIFLENPELGVLPTSCFGRPLTFDGVQSGCNVDFGTYASRMRDYRSGVFAMKAKVPGLQILDPESLLCDKVACRGILNDRLLYVDENHLSIEGSRFVAASLASQLLAK